MMYVGNQCNIIKQLSSNKKLINENIENTKLSLVGRAKMKIYTHTRKMILKKSRGLLTIVFF